ncbi:hypothetical protein G3M48_003252, partial [Beauveria asiatica]
MSLRIGQRACRGPAKVNAVSGVARDGLFFSPGWWQRTLKLEQNLEQNLEQINLR